MAGRHPFYRKSSEMEAKINEYFHDIFYDENGNRREEPKNPTLSGLSYFLGFEDRLSLWEYGKKDEFKHVLKRAKLRIEEFLENKLQSQHVVGTIFNLKNNFGWKDNKGIEVSGGLNEMTDDELNLKIQSLIESMGEK